MADKNPVREDAGMGAPLSGENGGGGEVADFAREGDFKIAQRLDLERVLDMRQRRSARRIAFRVLAALAVLSGLMMAGLGISVYFFGRCSPLKIFLEHDAHWPLGIFISGTFLSFIAVCGGLAFGVFTSARRKREEK